MKYQRFIPYLFLLTATLLIVVSYKDIVHTFYQQDEWLTLGYVRAGAGLGMLEKATFLDLLGGKYRVLSLPMQIFIYQYIGFNTYAIGIMALALHLFASFILYWVLNMLTENKIVSFITGLLFVVLSTSIQSISWYATTFQTIPSFIFLFLSLYFTMVYIKVKESRYFWFSFISSVAAFLFKESGGIALLLNPILYILYSKSRPNIIFLIRKYAIFIGYVAYIGYSRYLSVLVTPQYLGSTYLSASSSAYQKILINALLYPYLSFSQIFLPQKFVYESAVLFQNVYYQCCTTGSTALSMAQNLTSDLLASFFSTGLVLIVGLAYALSKKKATLQFLILFYILSYFPFITLERGSSYMDSRYMYISSAIGSALIIYSLSELISSIRNKIARISLLGVVSVCIFSLMLIHIKIDRNIFRVLAYESQERLLILKQIKLLVPQLPEKPVFYIESNNKNGYYGVISQTLPFQQGIGHTLMVWYAEDAQTSKPLLASYFLWGIKDQGYKEFQNYGFGYYSDIKELQTAVQSNQIQKKQIIGLYYDTDQKKMTNITDTIIGKLY